MGKIRKNLASISVFMINLILMGVGFLFIKNSSEAGKIVSDDKNSNEEVLAEKKTAIISDFEKVPVTMDKKENVVHEIAPKKENIPSTTAPASKTNGNVSNSVNSDTSNTSSKKSSATTKTS